MEVFEDINLRKIARGQKSLQSRLDVKTNWRHKVKAKFYQCSVVCHLEMNSYFLGVLLDCKFPECMAGRERLASCRQWKGQASVPACSGSGKEEGLISLHPEGGSHVHVLCECVCLCVDTYSTFWCLYLKLLAVLLLDFDGSFEEKVKGYGWKVEGNQLFVFARFSSRFGFHEFSIHNCRCFAI